MGFLSRFFPARSLLSRTDNDLIVAAIREAENNSSGEVRVFVEKHCKWVNPLDRARDLFVKLKMHQTVQRNGVIIYVALKDHQLAIFGDEGIHQIVGSEYWHQAVELMLREFNAQHFAQGISDCVRKVGETLRTHFPHQGDKDSNELPDEIVFGR